MSTSGGPLARNSGRINPVHMHDLDNPHSHLSELRESASVHRLGDSSLYPATSWELVSEVVRHPGRVL